MRNPRLRKRLFEFYGTHYTAFAHSISGAYLLIRDKCKADGYSAPRLTDIRELTINDLMRRS